MAGIKFSIDGVAVLSRSLRNLALDIKNTKPALEKAATRIIEHSTDMFDSGGRKIEKFPKWKPLKASTVRDKQKKGFGNKPIMVRTGKLRSEFKKNVTPTLLTVQKPTKYAIYHQRGNKKLPKRAVLELDNATIALIVKDLQKSVTDKIKSAKLN
ncbi:MAG: phage virion morphogenesis protein [Calditrichia bacterium]